MGQPLVPSENWAPYRLLWSRWLILARDDEGRPIPWTHGVRRNSKVWLPLFGVAVGWTAWGARSAWWRALLSFALGFLAGHFWW